MTIRGKDPALYEQMKAQRCATLEGIDIPQPVVSFSLEPASAAQTKMTEQALTCLNREDPSFQWRTNDYGQLIVQGMGELHLEIICSRLKSQYQLDTQLARAIIEYRESVRASSKLENFVIENNGTPLFAISLELEPVRESENTQGSGTTAAPPSSSTEGATSSAEEADMDRIPVSNTVRWIWTPEAKKQMLDRISAASQKVAASEGGAQTLGRHQKKAADDIKYIDTLFERSLLERVSTMGPLASLRLVGIAVRVTDLRLINPGVVGINFGTQCDKALEELCRRNPKKVLAEPMMEIEVHLSEPKYIGDVLRDISEREPAAVETLEDNRSIRATVPLRCITRYVTHLRKAAKGNAYYFANLSYFKEVSKAEVRQKILSELR
jgi:elongation factor G